MPRTKLREAREAADLTQEELATRIGAEKKAVCAWETGAQRPQPGHRRAVRDTLHNDDPDLFKNFESDPEDANEEDAIPPQPCYVVAIGETVEPIGPHENEEPAFPHPFHEKAAHDTGNSTDSHYADIQESAFLQPDHTKAKWGILTFAPPSSLQSFFVTSPINRLLCIAHTDYSTPNEMTYAIQMALEDFDTMNLDPITRREALRTLAALPMATLGTNPVLKSSHYEETLRHCTAALEGCWQLYRSSDPVGTKHAFDCCSTYMLLLEHIAHNSDYYRQRALDLAARYAILQTLIGSWGNGHASTAKTASDAERALSLSRESGNIVLLLSAFTKLSWVYLTDNKPKRAWQTMQEGEHILKSYQHTKKSVPLPSGVIGCFYSSYSIAQVDNGMSPDHALGIATDSAPLDEPIAFMEFTPSSQWLEAARICRVKGDFKQAIMWVGKRIDLETFTPRIPQSKRGHIQSLNTLTNSLLQSPERNLEKIIKSWTVATEGAIALRSEHIYQKALANFEIMKALYPREQAVKQLAPLTEHW